MNDDIIKNEASQVVAAILPEPRRSRHGDQDGPCGTRTPAGQPRGAEAAAGKSAYIGRGRTADAGERLRRRQNSGHY